MADTPPHPTEFDDLDAVHADIRSVLDGDDLADRVHFAATRTADYGVTSEAIHVTVPVKLYKAAEILHERVGPTQINVLDDLGVHDSIVGYILELLAHPLERELDPYVERVDQIVRRHAG